MRGAISIILAASLATAALAAQADSELMQSCNDMYPADSYEMPERGEYIQECLRAYGAYDEPEALDGETSTDEPSAGYYDGTVEEYVESVPEEAPPYAETQESE